MHVMKFRSVQPNTSSIGAEDALDEEPWIAILDRFAMSPGARPTMCSCSWPPWHVRLRFVAISTWLVRKPDRFLMGLPWLLTNPN